MATINYELSKRTDSNNNHQILVRISVSRNFRVGGKTRMFVNPKDWDDKNGCIRKISKIENKNKQRELEFLRKQLTSLTNHISDAIIETTDLESKTDKKERQAWIDYIVASFYDPSVKLTKVHNMSFVDFARVYVEVRSKEENWKPATMGVPNQKKKWKSPIYDKLSAVLTQITLMNPNLMMDDITGQTLDDYQNFLLNKKFLNSTIEKHICYLRQILKWADERGYPRNGKEVVGHKTKKLKLAPPKATNYLTWDEFEKLFNYEFGEDEKHLELTRDRFCFCCATSLRHSDLQILKTSDFNNFETPEFFTFVSQKTHDDLTIFLNKWSLAIYHKYKDIETPGGLLFPPKSRGKMSDNLKVIAQRLGFTRIVNHFQYCGEERVEKINSMCDVISTHTARRSFVVHALENNWSALMVMTYTGHEDIDSLKPYIAITDKTRKHLMDTSF